MKSIYVLNRSFQIQGVIDSFTSCIWRPAYYGIGDFELYVPADEGALELLKVNNYIVRSSDISVLEGAATYKKVMIIKNIKLVTNIETGDFLIVTGRELKYILHSRIVWQQTHLSGKVENGIRTLVTQNAISPTDSKRTIPGLTLGVLNNLPDTFRKQITGKQLDEAIIDICATYNYGWDIYISNNKLVLSVYAGIDRSYDQSNKPYVVFSDAFDNLFSSDYELNTENYANTALIGGEGEGVERIYTSVNTDISGLDRYEHFTDAKDISRNKDTEEEITLEEYITILKQRGSEQLAELNKTEQFVGEVLNAVVFTYGVDYHLGDVVTVINKYGIIKNVRVVSAIESDDQDGAKLIPQFLF